MVTQVCTIYQPVDQKPYWP